MLREFNLNAKESVLLTHGDSIDQVATEFKVIARSGGAVAGISSDQLKIYGLQFHPEVDLTTCGLQILKNFLITIAGCQQTYTLRNRQQQCMNEICNTVKDKKVLMLCSGGVDSTVCAALLTRALGKDRVKAVLIDNGFMRRNEATLVHDSLKAIGLHVEVRYMGYVFYYATTELHTDTMGCITTESLCQTTDPEIKRRIIGDTFMRVVKETLGHSSIGQGDMFLAQGTLRPDLIESASSLASANADAIKTHHNDTELVRKFRSHGRLIEILKDFHKDEVRALGVELGLPDSIINRHPFPGPGLAVRILCCVEPFRCKDFNDTQTLLRAVAQLYAFIQRENHITEKIRHCLSEAEYEWLYHCTKNVQLNATLLPIRTVGVQGDHRSYSYVAAVSSNCSSVPWGHMLRLAKVIPKVLHKINRVVYVIGPIVEHPVHDVTPTFLTSLPIAVAREADFVAHEVLLKRNLTNAISQMPVVLIPVHFDRPVESSDHPSILWSVCLRPFITKDFMTGVPAEPGKDIPSDVPNSLADSVLKKVPFLSRVVYDLTPKPPGTVEWE
ncbi:unnamed protein product [Soboliphyme baturini]|uniref:GMP synthase (glutamine-hydrolyzing) n=1 Tax=Soboliphyme baturini TaxID=241478 RepID=A0A183IQQ8_9BILA|nr:unnamed protein product [Soboliphyme baturini]